MAYFKKIKRAREIQQAKKIYEEQVAAFNKFSADTTFPRIEKFYWYHSVEVADGIVTPGDYDYRNSLAGFCFPENMTGMTVLDVGSATGFFAFEFAKRGANVVSVELPSLSEWDMVHGENEKIVTSLMHFHQAATPQEAFYCHLDGPFKFCQAQKNASIRRIYSSIYNIGSQLGGETFDLVFLGDILVHLFSPFAALNAVVPLCKSKLIISSDLFGSKSDAPLMEFVGTRARGLDSRSWWRFNRQCMEEVLLRVGFNNVKLAGEFSGVMRRAWVRYHGHVFHATR